MFFNKKKNKHFESLGLASMMGIHLVSGVIVGMYFLATANAASSTLTPCDTNSHSFKCSVNQNWDQGVMCPGVW